MNLIATFDMMSRMADVMRYSRIRLTTPESVLEHTAFVALMAFMIATEINVRSKSIPMDWVMAKALVHDGFDEIVTGDIPRPTKYYSPEIRAIFKKIGDEGAARVIVGLEISEPAAAMITFFRDRAKTGPTGVIVGLADTLAVVYKSWDEVLLRNNMSMCSVALSTLDDLNKISAEIEIEFAGMEDTLDFLHKIVHDAYMIATEAANKGRKT